MYINVSVLVLYLVLYLQSSQHSNMCIYLLYITLLHVVQDLESAQRYCFGFMRECNLEFFLFQAQHIPSKLSIIHICIYHMYMYVHWFPHTIYIIYIYICIRHVFVCIHMHPHALACIWMHPYLSLWIRHALYAPTCIHMPRYASALYYLTHDSQDKKKNTPKNVQVGKMEIGCLLESSYESKATWEACPHPINIRHGDRLQLAGDSQVYYKLWLVAFDTRW